MKSAQIPSLILSVYYGDDNVDDCDDYNGHLQKNLPEDVRKEFLFGRNSVRCDPLESLKWVAPAAKLLELPPHVCLVYDDDDNFDDCVDGYGHIQRNSPSDGQKIGPRWEDVHPF